MSPRKGRSNARRKRVNARKLAMRAQEMAPLRMELRKRVQHAMDVLRPFNLPDKAMRECTIALAEIHGLTAKKEAASRVVQNFPRVTPTAKEQSPNLYQNYLAANESARRAEHEFNLRFYKLVLELEVLHPGQGKIMTHRIIQRYEDSFHAPPKK